MADTFLQITRFIIAGMMLIAGLFLLSFVITATEPESAQAKSTSSDTKPIGAARSPNVVTNGFAGAINKIEPAINSAGYAISDGVQSATSTVAQTGKVVIGGVRTGTVATARGVGNGLTFSAQTNAKTMGFVGHTIGTGVSFAANTVGSGVSFVANIPGNVFGFVTSTSSSVVNAFIKPADHEEVPIIDPDSTELQTAIAALPPAKKSSHTTSKRNPGPQWPIRGRVTTEFGVAHWPFQPTHTGIDISDNQPSGVTPIKPFRPGRVINTVHSSWGLGNHVIVDHGNGVTSVYAHLASISVKVGQKVGLNTTLGFEGTTGVSTGTHLHLEIRVHGQAADPRQFINGQP